MSTEQLTEHVTQAFAKQANKPINTASSRPSPDVIYLSVPGVGDIRVSRGKWEKMNEAQREAFLAQHRHHHGFKDVSQPADKKNRDNNNAKSNTEKKQKFSDEFGSIRTYYSRRWLSSANRFATSVVRQPGMVIGGLYRQTDFAYGSHEMGRYMSLVGTLLMVPGAKMAAKDLIGDIAMQNNILQAAKRGMNLSTNMSRGEFMQIDAEANGFVFKPKTKSIKGLTKGQSRIVSETLQLRDVEAFLLQHQNVLGKDGVKLLREGKYFNFSNLKELQKLRSDLIMALRVSGGGIPMEIGHMSVGQLKHLLKNGNLNPQQVAAIKQLITWDKQAKVLQARQGAARSRRFKLMAFARGILMQTDAGQAVNAILMVTRTARLVGKTGIALGRVTGKFVYRNIKYVTGIHDRIRASSLKKAKSAAKLQKIESRLKKTENLRKAAAEVKHKIQKVKTAVPTKRSIKASFKQMWANSKPGKALAKFSNSKLMKVVKAPVKGVSAFGAAVKKIAGWLLAAAGYFLLGYFIILILLMGIGEGINSVASVFNSSTAQDKVQTAVAEINKLEAQFEATLSSYKNAKPITKDLAGNPIESYGHPLPDGTTSAGVYRYYYNYDYTQLSPPEQQSLKVTSSPQYATKAQNGRYIMGYAAVFFLQDFDSVSESALKDFSSSLWKATHVYRPVESALYPCDHTNCKADFYSCAVNPADTLKNKWLSSNMKKEIQRYWDLYGKNGGCHYVFHNEYYSTDSDLLLGGDVQTRVTPKELNVGSSAFRGAKYGSVYYSKNSANEPITITVNPECNDYSITYCGGTTSCPNHVAVMQTTTYYICGGHTGSNGNKTYHGTHVNIGAGYDHASTSKCSNCVNTVSQESLVWACGGHVNCNGHHYCPAEHSMFYCTGHVDVDIDVIVFDFDNLYTQMKAMMNDDYGMSYGPVATLDASQHYYDYLGHTFSASASKDIKSGTEFIDFNDSFLASIFPNGVMKARDRFRNSGGWDEGKKEIVKNIAEQDWRALYNVIFANEFPATPFTNASIRETVNIYAPRATEDQMNLLMNALSLVNRVNYFPAGGHDKAVEGFDEHWGEYVKYGGKTIGQIFEQGAYYPYGLDGAGMARWVYYNTFGVDLFSRTNGFTTFPATTQDSPGFISVSRSNLQPGDIVLLQTNYGFVNQAFFVGTMPNGEWILVINSPSTYVMFNHASFYKTAFVGAYRFDYDAM